VDCEYPLDSKTITKITRQIYNKIISAEIRETANSKN
jgi:hypothetical protein